MRLKRLTALALASCCIAAVTPAIADTVTAPQGLDQSATLLLTDLPVFAPATALAQSAVPDASSLIAPPKAATTQVASNDDTSADDDDDSLVAAATDKLARETSTACVYGTTAPPRHRQNTTEAARSPSPACPAEFARTSRQT